MAARPQTSAFGPILLAIKQKLLTDVLGADGYVVIGRKEADATFIGERYCKIIFSGVKTNPQAAIGRHFKRVKRIVSIELASRNSLDIPGEAEIKMTNVDDGHLYFEEAVVASLDLKNIRNATNTDNLTYQPIRLLDDNPGYEPSMEPTNDMLWSVLHFEVDYGFPFTDSV